MTPGAVDRELRIFDNAAVNARRFLAFAVAIFLLLPSAAALAMTAHLAWEHPADHPHAEHPAMLAVAEHGHSHAATDPAHEHSVAGGPEDAAVRRAAAPLLMLSVAGAAMPATGVPPLAAAGHYARHGAAGRPSICGPPLLALLSILRI